MNEELISILKSDMVNKDLVSNVRYLLSANVLHKDEINLCERILEQIELFGCFDLEKALKDINYNIDNINSILGYQKLELVEKIEDFIRCRKAEERESIILEIGQDDIKKENLTAFFNNYVDSIQIKENNVFEDLLLPKNNIEKSSIYSGSYIVDNFMGKIESGTVTTITSNSIYLVNQQFKNVIVDYKELLAINIAYDTVKNQKNVVYISLGKSAFKIYSALLSRHSYNDEFKRPLTFYDIYNNWNANEEVILPIYQSFKDKCVEHLIVFDESEFDISTHYNLQRLFVYAENEFQKRFSKGVDVIIIDNFSFMKLETKRRSIINKNIIANEYYKYLRNQSKNFLGLTRQVTILLTNDLLDNGIGVSKNDGNYLLEYILYEIQVLSDNIIGIYGTDYLNKSDLVKIQVVKSKKGNMPEAAYNHVFIDYYATDYSTSQIIHDIGYEYFWEKSLSESNSVLEEENKRLKEEIASLKPEEEITIEF